LPKGEHSETQNNLTLTLSRLVHQAVFFYPKKVPTTSHLPRVKMEPPAAVLFLLE